jgi:hypothetical protein
MVILIKVELVEKTKEGTLCQKNSTLTIADLGSIEAKSVKQSGNFLLK